MASSSSPLPREATAKLRGGHLGELELAPTTGGHCAAPGRSPHKGALLCHDIVSGESVTKASSRPHAPAAAPQHTCPRPAAPQHALQKPLAGCHPILTRTISRYELCSNTNPWSARHGILPPFGKAKVCTNRTRLPGPKPQPNCKFPMLDIATPEATNLAVPPVRQHYKNSVLQIATVSPSSQHLLNSVGRAPPKVWVQLPIW